MRPKGTKAELEARRRRAVAMLNEGKGVCEVARLVGATSGAVTRWRQRYEREGTGGLDSIPHPGSRPRLSVADHQRLAELLLEGPRAHGFNTDLWTLARVAEVIERHFGVTYHVCHVWKVLRRMGWSNQKPERRAREQNEAAVARWREVDWPRIKGGHAVGAVVSS